MAAAVPSVLALSRYYRALRSGAATCIDPRVDACAYLGGLIADMAGGLAPRDLALSPAPVLELVPSATHPSSSAAVSRAPRSGGLVDVFDIYIDGRPATDADVELVPYELVALVHEAFSIALIPGTVPVQVSYAYKTHAYDLSDQLNRFRSAHVLKTLTLGTVPAESNLPITLERPTADITLVAVPSQDESRHYEVVILGNYAIDRYSVNLFFRDGEFIESVSTPPAPTTVVRIPITSTYADLVSDVFVVADFSGADPTLPFYTITRTFTIPTSDDPISSATP